jgi:hypothetical protein
LFIQPTNPVDNKVNEIQYTKTGTLANDLQDLPGSAVETFTSLFNLKPPVFLSVTQGPSNNKIHVNLDNQIQNITYKASNFTYVDMSGVKTVTNAEYVAPTADGSGVIQLTLSADVADITKVDVRYVQDVSSEFHVRTKFDKKLANFIHDKLPLKLKEIVSNSEGHIILSIEEHTAPILPNEASIFTNIVVKTAGQLNTTQFELSGNSVIVMKPTDGIAGKVTEISYDASSNSAVNIRDENNVSMESFSKIIDLKPPVFLNQTSFGANNKELVLYFDEALKTNTLAVSDFAVNDENGAKTVTTAVVDNSSVKVTVSADIQDATKVVAE